MELEEAFRELRNKWFAYHLKSHPHARMDDGEKLLKIKYDEQTEAIIKGENKPLAPTCSYDME